MTVSVWTTTHDRNADFIANTTLPNVRLIQADISIQKNCLPIFIKAMRLDNKIEVYDQIGEDYQEISQSTLYTLTEADGNLDELFEDRDRLRYWAWLKIYADPTIDLDQFFQLWREKFSNLFMN